MFHRVALFFNTLQTKELELDFGLTDSDRRAFPHVNPREGGGACHGLISLPHVDPERLVV
jgi:hypothetical protein